MEIVPKVEYETNGAGQIVKVTNGAAAIEVKWDSDSAELIPYANFIISEVCSNRGIENPRR